MSCSLSHDAVLNLELFLCFIVHKIIFIRICVMCIDSNTFIVKIGDRSGILYGMAVCRGIEQNRTLFNLWAKTQRQV